MAMELARVRAVVVHYSGQLNQVTVNASTWKKAAYVAEFCDRLIVMIDKEPERREKIMRWYGFIQGALWVLGYYTIDEIKDHSRPDVTPEFMR